VSTHEKYRCLAEHWHLPSLADKKGNLRESLVAQAPRARREEYRRSRVPAAAYDPGHQGGFWIGSKH
jgi:hypothetical protein